MKLKAFASLAAAALALGVVLVGSPAQSVKAAGTFSVIATVNVVVNPFGDTIAPDGKTVWVANSGVVGGPAGSTVTVLDAKTFAIRTVIPVGLFPEDIAFSHLGSEALVTNSTSDSVSVINTQTRLVTQTVSLAPVPMEFPFGIISSLDSTKVFVTSVGGQRDTSLQNIAILNNANSANVTLDGAIKIQGFTGRSALTPDGSLLVVSIAKGDLGPPEVLFVNPATNAIVGDLQLLDQTTQGAVEAVQVSPDGKFAYADVFGTSGGVWVINLATRSTATVVHLNTKIIGGGITPDGRFVFANEFDLAKVAVISAATNTVITTLSVGNLPNDVAVTPDSTLAFVTNQGDTTVSVISIPSP